MAGCNFRVLQVALCKASTLHHHERRPVSSRHNFTVQTTRQKRLAHGDNAVAYIFCHVAFQLVVPSKFLSTNMSSAQMILFHKPRDRSRFILGTFRHFCRMTRFQHKWRPAEHWTALMHLYYDIPESLRFNGDDLKDELRRDPAMRIDIKRHHKLPNLHGIYHDQYRPDKKKNIHCYYACKPGEEHVHAPPTGKWHDSIPSIPELEKECQAVARSTRTQRELPHDVIDIISRVSHLAEERPTKRTRLDEEEADNSTSLSASLKSTPALRSTTIELLPLPPVVVEPPESSQPAPKLPDGTNIYWDSAEAKRLFNALDNETALDRLDDLIEVLEHVNGHNGHNPKGHKLT